MSDWMYGVIGGLLLLVCSMFVHNVLLFFVGAGLFAVCGIMDLRIKPKDDTWIKKQKKA